MADDNDPISTDYQFLIEYYWEDLIKRIDISSSSLIDELLTRDVITQEQGDFLKVLFVFTCFKFTAFLFLSILCNLALIIISFYCCILFYPS